VWENLEIGTKTVILKYCLCTTYCSTSQQRERYRTRKNDCMKNQPSSHSTDSFTAPSCHCHSFSCSFSAPWNSYHDFPRFWDHLHGPLRQGLSTEVRLWSQLYLIQCGVWYSSASPTKADSQWNPVYNAFHPIFGCGNKRFVG